MDCNLTFNQEFTLNLSRKNGGLCQFNPAEPGKKVALCMDSINLIS